MSRFWLLVIALLGIALALLSAPALSARIIVALTLTLIAGATVGYLLLRSRSVGRDTKIGRENSSVEAESQLFALGKLFDATLSGMREGLIVVDRDMRVIAANAAAHQLFTVFQGPLESKRLTELTRNTAVYTAFLGALKGNTQSGVKVDTHASDPRVFDLRVVPLKSGQGEMPHGALGVFFDVTRLERLESVRQEFLSNVSHELRTPLTAIMAFVETLETGEIREADSQRFLSIIRRNADRMHDLIDDILELSAIEAGNVQVKPEQIDLRAVVNEVLTSLAARASAGSVQLKNDVPVDAMVFADSRRLEQMLTNLVDNAIKFNKAGGRVTVGLQNGSNYRISVEDTGEGIPARHLPRLFERFYRVDKARSRELGGTGLGLAIVKHLARAHGGDVSVESVLGEGSIFAIELPKSAAPPAVSK